MVSAGAVQKYCIHLLNWYDNRSFVASCHLEMPFPSIVLVFFY